MTVCRAYGTLRSTLHRKAHDLASEAKRLKRASDEQPVKTHGFAAEVAAPAAGPADVVIRNARLLDAPDTPVDIAITGGVFSFVGEHAAAADFVGEGTEEIDAEGHTVLPGLCDAHVHLLVGAERRRGCDVEDVRSAEAFKSRVGRFAADNPDKGALYVYGLHYLDPPIIPAATARQLLDEIEADRPLFVYAHDLHTAWANSKALELAGLLQKVPPYPPLLKVLDLTENLILADDGLPTGEMKEPPVYFLVESALHHRFALSAEEKLTYLEAACKDLASFGITRVHNMGLGSPEEDIELLMLLLELEQTGRLAIRVFSSYSVLPDEHMLTDVSQAAAAARGLTDARAKGRSYGELHALLLDQLEAVAAKRDDSLTEMTKTKPGLKAHPDRKVLAEHSGQVRSVVHKVHLAPHQARRKKRVAAGNAVTVPKTAHVALQAVKVFMDGVIEKHTAYRLDLDPVEGIPAFTQAEIDQVVGTADRFGLQVAAHAIGDGSVRSMLDAIAAARKRNEDATEKRGYPVRHRIEHIELCDPADVGRFHELDVVPSMQPFHERAPWTLWHHTVPKARWKQAFQWRTLEETGVRLVFGSDWPIVSCDCLKATQHAVDRKPWAEGLPDQSVTIPDALRAFSSNTALIEHMEGRLGEVAEGQLGDLVILSGRLADSPPGELRPQVTICGGKVTYRR